MRKQLFWFLGGCVFASLLAALFLLVWPAGEKDDAGRVQRDAPPPPVAVAQQPIGAARQEPERALTVGVIGPESGEEAAYGLQVLNGVLLAAERFNEDGGIDGKPIEVLHYDNEGRPDRTLEIAQQLIESQVVAILSAPTGWSSFGPTHMADATSTIFISVGTRRRLGAVRWRCVTGRVRAGSARLGRSLRLRTRLGLLGDGRAGKEHQRDPCGDGRNAPHSSPSSPSVS